MTDPVTTKAWFCDGCDAETTGECAAKANPEDCSAREGERADAVISGPRCFQRMVDREGREVYCVLPPGHEGDHGLGRQPEPGPQMSECICRVGDALSSCAAYIAASGVSETPTTTAVPERAASTEGSDA